MPKLSPVRRALPAAVALLVALANGAAPAAGPKVPDGFSARLVASVPAVEFPCQVATATDGALFVAEDPMDQRGPYEAFDGRILRFVDGNDPQVFADGFRAIQGMAWREGALYVCHMPFLTVVKDTNGDGKADARTDLFKDLGPTNNRGLNDHIVSGIQFGMDGWLYISVGDKGVPGAKRPEDGAVVQLMGGGVLRCRPDGRELEVYSSGTRNHLEANLDAADRVFTYDNTDDGDGWWTRVTHHINGGYYGYPYDYHDHPERFLPRMAEYGGGSPCGGAFYREDAWPETYRGIGLWAEWGKGKVHAFRFREQGASFEVAEAIDFATPNGVDNFRPIDVAVSHDGKTLYIADWNMGGWGNKNEKVGRVWAVTHDGPSGATRPRGSDADPLPKQVAQLDHPAHAERLRAQAAIVRAGKDAIVPVTTALADPKTPALARRHLLWALDALAGGTPDATVPILAQLESKGADLRAQAARALGQRRVPVAVEPLAKATRDADPAVRLEAAIALGRIADPGAIPALLTLLADEDVYISFAARAATRRIGDWKAVAAGLEAADPKVRAGVRLAAEGVYDADAAGLLAGVSRDPRAVPAERALALNALAEVERKARPWDGRWWGTRPTQGGPPRKVDTWAGTDLVRATIAAGLDDPAPVVRYAAIAAVEATENRTLAEGRLRALFAGDPDPDVRAAIALALGKLKDRGAVPALAQALRAEDTPEPLRAAALSAIATIGTDAGIAALVDLLGDADGPPARTVELIDALGRLKAKAAVPALAARVASPDEAVQEAAAEALAAIGRDAAAALPALRARLEDGSGASLSARKSVLNAIGALGDREAVPALIAAAGRDDTRFEATRALAALADPRGLPVLLRGLIDANPALRSASAKAVAGMRDEVAPTLDELAGRKELSPRVVAELRKVFDGLRPIAAWHVVGPFARGAMPPFDPAGPIDLTASYPGQGDKLVTWAPVKAVDGRGQVDLGRRFGGDARAAFAYAEIAANEPRDAELAVGSDDTLTVWLNGEQVYEHATDRGFAPEQDRVKVRLRSGANRLLVKCGNTGGGWQFAVALTEPASYAFLRAPAEGAFDPEAFRAFALRTPGDAGRGRALFADEKGLNCAKCHVVAGKGGNVGPDLTGIGSRYPKDELIASVLYPSEKIFSGYEPVVVATADGRVLTGILKAETPEAVEIQDAEAQRLRIPKEEIDERKNSAVSLMPSGLADGLSREAFADLIAYLTSLKEAPASAPAAR
jgi:putative membrane-bound dehydrogenase-like protein